ncbi:MAG: hypothetical protein ACO3G4_16330 [Opitutaceae bacterium]|jgi:hypothetical protein
MTSLFLLAGCAACAGLEIWQLVQAERLLGRRAAAAPGPDEARARRWSLALLAYWLGMVGLLFLPLARLHALGLLLVTMIGFSLRRGAERLWTLRLLTFEGAIRIGLLLSLAVLAWRRL